MLHIPPRKILVPFDFTEQSMLAWKHAHAWAARFHAELELLYVDNLADGASEREEILAHLRAKLGELPSVQIAAGAPVAAILHAIRVRRPDLVVMGTHGRTGFERLWSGSVTEAVVRRSSVPVLVVRAPRVAAGLEKLLRASA